MTAKLSHSAQRRANPFDFGPCCLPIPSVSNPCERPFWTRVVSVVDERNLVYFSTSSPRTSLSTLLLLFPVVDSSIKSIFLMNPALIRSRSLNFSRVRSIPSRTWIEAATSTSSLILSSSLAQTRSASTSTFENLVAFRRRNNLDELPKLDSKERSSKNKKKFGDSAANRLRISKHSEWTDDQKEIFYRTRAGQRKLNEALSEIHSEMKRASRHSSYRPEGLSSPISSNDQLWEQAFELFESSPKAHQRDFRVYNQLVAMAFKAGKFNRAMDLVSDVSSFEGQVLATLHS